MKKIHTTLFCWSLFALPIFCQTEQKMERMTWDSFVEMMMEESEEEVDETLMEQLYELHGNPLDINEVKKEDLEALPFLSEEQVEGIVRYVEKNRPVQSLGELMFVKELGKAAREMLRLFVEVKEGKRASWHDDSENLTVGKLLKHGKNEAVWRTDVPFYRKAGYEDVPAEVLAKSPNKVYRGDRFHHSLRYAFSSRNHLLAGLNMEKDAGEQGVDYVSGYVQVKDWGIVKNAIVGNYRLSFGKGLAVNTSAKFGKMMMFSSMDRMDAGITKHSSTMEDGYFTGGAATLRMGQVEVSAFGSHRKGDGTYNNDSTGMSSLKTDGLHRTQLEHSKKGNFGITNFGGNIHWGSGGLQLSATAVATHLSVPLAPKHDTPSTTYRYYNAHGQDFFVGSLAYAYRHQTLTFSGETALSNNEHQSGTATLNALRWRVSADHVLTLIGRYYGAKFVSPNGKTFGENSAVQNEEGVFLSWTTQSVRNTLIEAYVDAMYFPWLKHQVSESSYGYEGMLQATYAPTSRWSLLARYRIKAKQKDFTLEEGTPESLEYNTSHNLKLQLSSTLSPSVSLRTSVAGTLITFGNNPNEKGLAIGENIRWQNPKNKCRIDFGITYFNTDSYNARVYHYEPTLLYSFGSTSYYYEGIRTTLLASIPIMKQSLSLNAKLGMTRYFDRDTIGTGLEMIDANHREDLQVQVRWKF